LDATAASIDRDDEGGDRKILKIPLPPPRPRERKKILVPGGSATEPRRIDQAFVLALARAMSWMRALRHGERTPPRSLCSALNLFFGMTKLLSKLVSLKTLGPKKPGQVNLSDGGWAHKYTNMRRRRTQEEL
jgi:hypothetical protein